jgi:hypothetical protein
MSTCVQWRLLFRVSNQKSLDKCLSYIRPLLGDGCKFSEGRPYWKDPDLWECDAVGPLLSRAPAEQAFACLLTAQRLASPWCVMGSFSAESAEGLSGVFAVDQNAGRSKVAGLTWASFDIVAA